MKIAFFDTHSFDREAFTRASSRFAHQLRFFDVRLTAATAQLALGSEAVCAFVNDRLDVYEEEEGIFFHDLSNAVLSDDVLARLLTFPNVLITSHQAFLTREALENIAETTLENVAAFERGELRNEVPGR